MSRGRKGAMAAQVRYNLRSQDDTQGVANQPRSPRQVQTNNTPLKQKIWDSNGKRDSQCLCLAID
jgi:hypothetical protein